MAIGLAMVGSAHASSFVAIAPPPAGKSPSIVVMDSWKPDARSEDPRGISAAKSSANAIEDHRDDSATIALAYPLPRTPEAVEFRIVVVSSSIIAFDPPAPSVTFEQVAAIETAPKEQLHSPPHHVNAGAPIVIRGGIVGGASGEAVSVALPSPKAAPTTAARAGETKINAAGKKVVVIDASAPPKQKTPGAPAPAENRAAALPAHKSVQPE